MKKLLLILLTLPLGAPLMSETKTKTTTASFGGGCFWCLEPFYEKLNGVSKVVSGYQGGKVKNPSYREVTTGRTGHAEVVQVTYDPQVISYEDLLLVFFVIHDPTTLNRQGADVGTQYRSAIFVNTDEERKAAEAYIKKLTDEKVFKDPIVTTIETGTFYEAENYHQDYFANNPQARYCQLVIAPKLKKIEIPDRLLKKAE